MQACHRAQRVWNVAYPEARDESVDGRPDDNGTRAIVHLQAHNGVQPIQGCTQREPRQEQPPCQGLPVALARHNGHSVRLSDLSTPWNAKTTTETALS